LMGRRQAVRHKILVLALGGSNPPAPAIMPFGGKVSNVRKN
jgi:hypothetical protein